MDNELLRYTLRVDRQLFAKFKYVAGYMGRSANKEIEQLMKQRIKKFESMHGAIEIGIDDDK